MAEKERGYGRSTASLSVSFINTYVRNIMQERIPKKKK